jgi:hypothetical protein
MRTMVVEFEFCHTKIYKCDDIRKNNTKTDDVYTVSKKSKYYIYKTNSTWVSPSHDRASTELLQSTDSNTASCSTFSSAYS